VPLHCGHNGWPSPSGLSALVEAIKNAGFAVVDAHRYANTFGSREVTNFPPIQKSNEGVAAPTNPSARRAIISVV